MLRDAVLFGFGIGFGWIIFERPQWATDVWQWVKNKVHPDKPPVPPVVT